MPLPSNRMICSLTLCISTLIFLTLNQQQSTSYILTSSTVFFSFAYGVVLKTRLFHPPNNIYPKPLSPALESELRSRIVSTLHATILTIGSILCFIDWRHLSHSAAWANSDAENVPQDLEPGQFYPWFFAAVFGGFLQYDIIWIISNFDEYADISSLIHHVVFTSVTHYNLKYLVFVRPFAWLSLTEFSTPFLNLRWYFAVTDQKNSAVYLWSSFAFAGTFLATRVVGYTWGIWDLWSNGYEIWSESGGRGKYVVVLGIHLGWILNLFWGAKVFHALMRAVNRTKAE